MNKGYKNAPFIFGENPFRIYPFVTRLEMGNMNIRGCRKKARMSKFSVLNCSDT